MIFRMTKKPSLELLPEMKVVAGGFRATSMHRSVMNCLCDNIYFVSRFINVSTDLLKWH